MFGKKKAKKETATTYIDGQRVDEDSVPVPKNPENATALEPEQVPVQEPPHFQEGQSEPEVVVVDCLICSQHANNRDYGFYIDGVGVWHNCPRCNPTGALKPTRVEKDDAPGKAKKKAKGKR